MKRLSKAVVLTATAGVTVLGAAGGAAATDGVKGHRAKPKTSQSQSHRHGHGHGHGHGATAKGAAVRSPGAISGNLIQVPIHVPINVCGNTVDGIAALNWAFGNVCVNR